jgi:hypothetical protein
MTCDSCNLTGDKCPGVEVHCANGEHCIDTVASCAMEWSGGRNLAGHPYRCEDCNAPLTPADWS